MVGADIDIIETVEMVTQVIKCGIGHTKVFCGISHNWQWKWSQFFCDHFHSQLWLIPQKFWVWPIPHLITCVTISTVSIMSMSTATIVTFSTEFFVTNYVFPYGNKGANSLWAVYLSPICFYLKVWIWKVYFIINLHPGLHAGAFDPVVMTKPSCDPQ